MTYFQHLLQKTASAAGINSEFYSQIIVNYRLKVLINFAKNQRITQLFFLF